MKTIQLIIISVLIVSGILVATFMNAMNKASNEAEVIMAGFMMIPFSMVFAAFSVLGVMLEEFDKLSFYLIARSAEIQRKEQSSVTEPVKYRMIRDV